MGSEPGAPSMLSIQGLNQFYGQSHTLWDLDAEFPTGQCTCVMGRNGVGKTTLMQCIMGLLPLRSGSMVYRGEHDLARLPAEGRARLGLGYVPQGRQIFPLLTVDENLTLGGFVRIEAFPLKLYVFYRNPLNYLGLAGVVVLEAALRIVFRLYGKKVQILSKKIGAVAFRA